MTLRRGRFLAVAALCYIACVTVMTAAHASASSRVEVPRTFFGVVPQDALTSRDYARMRGVVGTLRIPIYWFQVEPRPGEFDFDWVDGIVGRAADAGLRVVPFVYGSPPWIAGEEPAIPPLDTADHRRAWAGLMRKLVDRYGPRGGFWKGRTAKRPIRRWQIWNEPNFPLFWAPLVSAPGYARLLTIAARAIRGEDPGAKIVLAGLAPVENGPLPWVYLRRLYRVPGVARSFDVVALHPYSGTLASLAYQIEEARQVMTAAGDGEKSIEVTEFGVASGGAIPSPMVKSPAGQASFLRRAFGLLLANRARWRISGADWFTMRDRTVADPHCVFCQYAGLFDATDGPKPAWRTLVRLARGRAVR